MVFAPIMLLSGYLLYSSYSKLYNKCQEDVLLYLEGIAKTASLQINGNDHQNLLMRYTKMDDIIENKQDSLYLQLHTILKNIYTVNQLKTPIYTLVYDSLHKNVFFSASSSDTPFFRHLYKGFANNFLNNYTKGGTISTYSDENGKWLSAFAPVKNSAGNTIAVVQVDQKFDEFAKDMINRFYKNLALSVVILFAGILVMYKFLNRILISQEKASHIIQEKNREINQSINYSKRIIESALIAPDIISKYLPNSFVFYKPKDIVSGDFYWFYPLEKRNGKYTKFILGVFDCTGHGIPGAILSMLGIAVINDVLKNSRNFLPNLIFEHINKQFIQHLNQRDDFALIQDGMDGSLCVIDIENLQVLYSGAKRPLYLINNETKNLTEIKGDKYPLGGTHYDSNRKYTLHSLKVSKGDMLYMFTDGITDQFSWNGGKEKKIKSKVIKDFLSHHSHLSMKKQNSILSDQFENWKGNLTQTDDVTMIGLTI
ncbi:MAG: PP2C family protein-serine/threonine phosphatase [Bacteroidia bacterium]